LRILPYFTVGWLWYLGTLAPVIGIVQISIHAMADRYLYVPAIGIYLIIVWGSADILQKLRHGNSIIRIASFALITSLMTTTWVLSGYWVNSEVLFRRALALDVKNKNYLAHNGMGVALGRKNDFEAAAHHFSEAVRICPTYYEAQSNLGQLYMIQGKMAQAEEQFADIVRKAPGLYLANQNLAHILFMRNKYTEALVYYRKALVLKPSSVEAHNYLGVCLMTQGKIDEAITHFREALNIDPSYGRARINLNNAIEAKRRTGTGK
jgi:protein O-mannosyl-transferase